MLKNMICAAFLAFSGLGISAQQIDLVVKDVDMDIGWTSMEAPLAKPAYVNPFKVVFWIMDGCQTMPIVNIGVRFVGSPYWMTAEWKQGYYYTEATGLVEAVKLDFYQTKARQRCVLKVSGFLQAPA